MLFCFAVVIDFSIGLSWIFINGTVAVSIGAIELVTWVFVSKDAWIRDTFRSVFARDALTVLSHFYGYRVLLSDDVDPAKVTMFVSECQQRDDALSIVCATLLCLLVGFVTGIPTTQMIPKGLRGGRILYNLLKVLRCEPENVLDQELAKGQAVYYIRQQGTTCLDACPRSQVQR